MRRFAGLFPGMIGACILYSDDSPSESQSFGTIFFRFIWEKTKKDVVLCRQNTVQWCNGSTTDSGPVCPSSNLGWTTLKT